MNTKDLSILLSTALGPLETGWQAASGHGEESFTIIRYDGTLKRGGLRRMHALIEDLLSEELGEGDRVQ